MQTLKSNLNNYAFLPSQNQLTKGADQKPLDQDLNFICQYSPKNGIKAAVDSAVNLPWSNFTHAHMCLNPPAAFYLVSNSVGVGGVRGRGQYYLSVQP